MERMDLSTGEWIKQNTGEHMATAKRGGFDPYDNLVLAAAMAHWSS